jgi:predicted Zn-dependent peptidase
MRDDKPTWAALRATARTYNGTPGAIYEHGRVEELRGITAKGMLTRQRSLLGNAQVLVFVTGPVKPLHAFETIAKVLVLPQGERMKLGSAKKLKNREKPERFHEHTKSEQTHLLFTWSGGGVYGTPGFAPMLFADSMFGGYGMNRLFKVVREEHGLAYSVHSSYHRARGAIVAQAAVDNARADEAVKLIRSEFKRLQEDGFSDDEFAAVRESLIEGRRSSLDSQGARVADAVFQYIVGFQQSFEEQITELRNVTPKQVRAALKKLKPHSEYRLG